jgi:hypothetical protein
MDDSLFPDSPVKSAGASLSLGFVGMAASQGLVEKAEALSKVGSVRRLCVVRFAAIYSIAMSCVLVWRGTWITWDIVYEKLTEQQPTTPGHLSKSGIMSHGLASIGLLGCGLFASVLAPPAAACVIRDLAVKAGHKPYTGPAQKITQSFLRESFFQNNPRIQRTIHSTSRRKRLYNNK